MTWAISQVVGKDKAYLLTLNHITMHDIVVYPKPAQQMLASCARQQPRLAMVPSVPLRPTAAAPESTSLFFKEFSPEEVARKRIIRAAAVARYMAKQAKIPGAVPGRRHRQKQKCVSRQSIAVSRPRVGGRFAKTDVTIRGHEEQAVGDVHWSCGTTSTHEAGSQDG